MIVSIAMAACDGGGSCPFQKPSCCDNALFGCGPFDIPQGCSCSDYFSRAWSGAPRGSLTAQQVATKGTTDGTWRMSLQKDSGGCDYLSKTTVQNVQIREQRGRVTAKVMGIANMRGDRVDRRARLRGRVRSPLPRCESDIVANLTLVNPAVLSITGSISVVCSDRKLSCRASYTGSGRRL
jgi:hypothetical protein